MIIATSLVMDRLRKRLLELTPELPEDQASPAAMEQFVLVHGQEHDAEEAYRYYLSEKYGGDYSEIDAFEFAAGCRFYAMADVQDSWLIALNGTYFRLDGVTEE